MSENVPSLSGKGRAAAARPTFRPTVEALEDRLLLSAVGLTLEPGLAKEAAQASVSVAPPKFLKFDFYQALDGGPVRAAVSFTI